MSNKNVVVHSRVKPQVKRINRNISIPKTIQVISKPSKSKVVNIDQVKPIDTPKRVNTNKRQVISPNKRHNKRQTRKQKRGIRKSEVIHHTRNPSLDSINKIHKIRGVGRGKILVIIANGPSINEINIKELRNVDNIELLSINKPHQDIWPTSYWAFFDRTQLKRHEDIWKSYGGIIFNSTSITKQKEQSMQFKHLGGTGFSRDVSKGIHIGRSSVYAVMQIALWMEFDHIYILGCDMNSDGLNGKLHFYGVNPDVQPELRAKRFEREASSYDYAADNLSEIDRNKFTFCSDYNQWSFVDKFNKLNHKIAIDKILNYY